jgi:hypothetical protein
MNLDELKGRKFKYDSPHGGLSTWTDTVEEIMIVHSLQTNKEEGIWGEKLKISVIGTKRLADYPFERVIFLT